MDEHVTTTGSGSAPAVPDAMQVSLAVETTAPTVAEALTAVGAGATRASEVARRHTDATRISSQQFQVRPAFDEEGYGRGSGYLAAHAMTVVCDLDVAARLVSDLAEAVGDSLRIHVVRPVPTDTGALRRQARQLAFEEARATAQQYAELAGRRLGPALQVREGTDGHDWLEQSTALAASSAGHFEPGTVGVGVAVTVVWALLD